VPRDRRAAPGRSAPCARGGGPAKCHTARVPGEQLYLAEVRPADRADVVVDNRDFAAPQIIADRRAPP
jgi:hypothetical protein